MKDVKTKRELGPPGRGGGTIAAMRSAIVLGPECPDRSRSRARPRVAQTKTLSPSTTTHPCAHNVFRCCFFGPVCLFFCRKCLRFFFVPLPSTGPLGQMKKCVQDKKNNALENIKNDKRDKKTTTSGQVQKKTNAQKSGDKNKNETAFFPATIFILSSLFRVLSWNFGGV